MDLIVAVDFDGTLCKNKYPAIGEEQIIEVYDDGNYYTFKITDMLKYLQKEKNVKVILWTCRASKELEEAVKWCNERGLYFDVVNDDTEHIKASFKREGEPLSLVRKIFANVYIDDRSFGFRNVLSEGCIHIPFSWLEDDFKLTSVEVYKMLEKISIKE